MDLTSLRRETRIRQQKAFRPGTKANHKTQIKTYIAFCIYYGLQDLSPATETICMYVEFLTRSYKSPQTIKNYISGVRHLHKCLHIDSPSLDSWELSLMLRSICLTMDNVPKQHLTVTPEILKQIIECCNLLPTAYAFV